MPRNLEKMKPYLKIRNHRKVKAINVKPIIENLKTLQEDYRGDICELANRKKTTFYRKIRRNRSIDLELLYELGELGLVEIKGLEELQKFIEDTRE